MSPPDVGVRGAFRRVRARASRHGGDPGRLRCERWISGRIENLRVIADVAERPELAAYLERMYPNLHAWAAAHR